MEFTQPYVYDNTFCGISETIPDNVQGFTVNGSANDSMDGFINGPIIPVSFQNGSDQYGHKL